MLEMYDTQMTSANTKTPRPGDAEFPAYLQAKGQWIRLSLLEIHKAARETRVASSLSNCEILAALYYGGILRFDPKNQFWDGRDRFVISKGHGTISMYPVLADLGFFERDELKRVCQEGSILGGIPDPIIPGFETVNGSLGHGVGVAAGMAVALKNQGKSPQVFTLAGDGELHEGAVWEAIMFAGHHKLDNFNMIIDRNTKCMLDATARVLDLEPLGDKFRDFGWDVERVDGHNAHAVYQGGMKVRELHQGKPKVLICDTLKGKGVPKLEASPFCHILALNEQEIDEAIARLK
jgi:transketolase